MFPIIPFWIKRAGQWHELALHELPRCSRYLSYRQTVFPGGEGARGTFTFETVHLSKAVYEHLQSNAWDGKVTTRDHDWFEWLRDRDRDCVATTFLPSAWRGIEILILDIINNGTYEVWCPQCGRIYAPHAVVQVPSRESIGSIYNRRACPAGHLLSQIEVMHLCA